MGKWDISFGNDKREVLPALEKNNLQTYLQDKPGGPNLANFLIKNMSVGNPMLIGSTAEIISGCANPTILNDLENYWKRHSQWYPFRKKVADLDIPWFVDRNKPHNWNVDTEMIQVLSKDMNDGQQMVVVGEDIPEPGNHFDRRGNFDNQKVWAEIVPKDLMKGPIVDQLAASGYSQYTAVANITPNLEVKIIDDLMWVGRDKLIRSETVNAETLNKTLGLDTKYLKLAVKGLVNMALKYGENIPEALKNDITNLIKDRVDLTKEDWNKYQNTKNGVHDSDVLLFTAEPISQTSANNTFLWINVMERMMDCWVIMGSEATKIFEESGLMKIMFGNKEDNKLSWKKNILSTLNSGIYFSEFKNIRQKERLCEELTGLHILIAEDDLEI